MPGRRRVVSTFGRGLIRGRAGYLIAWHLNAEEESTEEGHEREKWKKHLPVIARQLKLVG